MNKSTLRRGASLRPNILIVVADDLRYNALGYLNAAVHTPVLDQLARSGIRFQNMFVTTSLGIISRASIFTGMYARRHGVGDFTTPLAADILPLSYPALLRESGYHTAFFGNYGVGNFDISSGKWRDAQFRAGDEAGFDVFGNYGFSYYLPDDTSRKNHIHSILVDRSEDFILSNPPDRPFCLSLSFASPHDQMFFDDPAFDRLKEIKDALPAEPDMLELYADANFPVGPLANEEAFRTLPEFIQRSATRHDGARHFTKPAKRREFFQRYYALVSGLDRAVGRILAVLERTGALENTAIIFTGDNGVFLGDFGLHEKGFGYEPAIRVPLMIRPVGQYISRDIAATALNIDLAPTMLAMAGAPIPPQVQGRDLSPLWKGTPSAAWRTEFLYELYWHTADGEEIPELEAAIPSSEGIRTDRYTYLRYPHQTRENETLFDRDTDPHQLHNLIQTAPRELVDGMRRRTDKLIAAAGATSAR